MVELCRALIRINTVNPYAGGEVSDGEKDAQEFLEPLMKELGGKTDLCQRLSKQTST